MLATGWCEEYGEFSEWLEEAGLTVDGLPAWQKRAPVRVWATPASLYLERVSRREYRAFRRMVARGEERLRAVPMAHIEDMHAVRITSVDAAKMATWKVNNDRCN